MFDEPTPVLSKLEPATLREDAPPNRGTLRVQFGEDSAMTPLDPSALPKHRIPPRWTRIALLGFRRAPCASGGPGGLGGEFSGGLPIPWQKLVDPLGGMIGQFGEDEGEPGVGIDLIQFASLDECVDGRRSSPPFIGSGEGPIASAHGRAMRARPHCLKGK